MRGGGLLLALGTVLCFGGCDGVSSASRIETNPIFVEAIDAFHPPIPGDCSPELSSRVAALPRASSRSSRFC
jgi:hypothetical protein